MVGLVCLPLGRPNDPKVRSRTAGVTMWQGKCFLRRIYRIRTLIDSRWAVTHSAAIMSDGRASGLSFRRRIQHFGMDFMGTGFQGLALSFPWPYEKGGIQEYTYKK